MTARQISTTILPVPFFMVLSTDHTTPATGKTPVVQISKNAGAFTSAVGAVTEIGFGWYSWAGNATDRNTIGEHAFRATAAGCDDTPGRIEVTWHDPFGTDFQDTLAQATTAATQATQANANAAAALAQATTAATQSTTAAAQSTIAATQATQAAIDAAGAAQSANSAALWAIVAVNRLGPWTADTTQNTVLGSLRALASTGASPSPDLVSGGLGFTPAANSLQTLRTRIDAVSGGGGGGGGGSGAFAVTITITDAGAVPLENATVRVTSGAESYALVTSVAGQVAFSLNAATWTVTVVRTGYQLAPQQLVISGNAVQAYQMAQVAFAPSTPGQVTGYLYTYSETGVVEPGVSCTLTLRHGPDPAVAYDSAPRTVVSDGSGKVEFANLFRGATYSLYRGQSRSVEITISPIASDPVAIGPVVGT